MAKRLLVPICVPGWMHDGLIRIKRSFVPPTAVGTWVDVGAHSGEMSLQTAVRNPGIRVYAFEPNLRLAATLVGRSSNYIVLPIAVSETDGCAPFHITENDYASSLMQLNEHAVRSWVGVAGHVVKETFTVPTMRLDTFMDNFHVATIDYLKIDAQGMDLAVLRSAGSRLRDILKITIEVWVAESPLYLGAATKEEVLSFLTHEGFQLIAAEPQTHGQEENLTFTRLDATND